MRFPAEDLGELLALCWLTNAENALDVPQEPDGEPASASERSTARR